jgi:hypothetical protein
MTVDVALQKQALPAFSLNQLFRFFRILVFVEVNYGHIRSLTCKMHTHGASNPTVTACDQRDFIFKFAGACVTRFDIFRSRVHFCLNAGLPVLFIWCLLFHVLS